MKIFSSSVYTIEANWANLTLRRSFTKRLLVRVNRALKYNAIGKELRQSHGNVARVYSAQVWFRNLRGEGSKEGTGKCSKILQKCPERGKTSGWTLAMANSIE